MKTKKRHYNSNRALIDILFVCLMVYLAGFILSVMDMNEDNPNKKVTEAKAEFIIIVEWPEEIDDDVDVYVEDPNGKLVFFRSREAGLMHLDRDDLGWRNDRVRMPDGSMAEYKENREIVTLRGIVKGEYVVNVHLYSRSGKHYEDEPYEGDPDDDLSIASVGEKVTPVKVRLEKINPFKTVTAKEVYLTFIGNEVTAFRFELSKDGEVVGLSDLGKPLATQRAIDNYSTSPYESGE